MARLRDIDSDPPRYPVVTPEGMIKMCTVAQNISGALELDEDGAPVVARAHAKRGWTMLQAMYMDDGRMDLWKAWADHQAAKARARRDGQKITAFPAEYLPAEVQRRRAGHRPGAHTWQMPALDPVKVDEPEKRATRSKRDA